MANTDTKLKPCPFCGSEATLISLSLSHFIACINSEECGSSGGLKNSPEKAIAAWNNRAADLKDWAASLGDVYNEVSIYSDSDEVLDMLDDVIEKINKAASIRRQANGNH